MAVVFRPFAFFAACQDKKKGSFVHCCRTADNWRDFFPLLSSWTLNCDEKEKKGKRSLRWLAEKTLTTFHGIDILVCRVLIMSTGHWVDLVTASCMSLHLLVTTHTLSFSPFLKHWKSIHGSQRETGAEGRWRIGSNNRFSHLRESTTTKTLNTDNICRILQQFVRIIRFSNPSWSMDRLEMLSDKKDFQTASLEKEASCAAGWLAEIGFPCNQRVGGFLLGKLFIKIGQTRDRPTNRQPLSPGPLWTKSYSRTSTNMPNKPAFNHNISVTWSAVITVARVFFFPATSSAWRVHVHSD